MLGFTRRWFSSSSRSLVTVKPLTGYVGAEIHGVDLTNLSKTDVTDIRNALWQWGVVFFRDQRMTNDAHVTMAKQFGIPDQHPIVKGLDGFPEVLQVVKEAGAPTKFGETWHSDNSYMECPSMGSILVGVELPEYGNDTMFACTRAAYDALSDGLKAMLKGMKAVHGAGRAFSPTEGGRQTRYAADSKEAMKYVRHPILDQEVEHPVVRTNPDSGRKGLYVNSMFTYRFAGWTDEESKPLLEYLYNHIKREEFTCRFRWQPGSVAMWDNRSVQHLAINDNLMSRRVMRRITLAGERPV